VTTPERAQIRTIETIDQDACWDLLRQATVARIAHVQDGEPHLSVVNVTMEDTDMLVRSSPGSRLSSALNQPGTPVAIEVDDLDMGTHTGWSVIARGEMRAVLDQVEVERLHRTRPASWLLGDRHGTWLRLAVSGVSGRRIVSPDGSTE
jgi:uncharacterized protein